MDGCSDVEIRAYINGELIQTNNVTFGCISGAIGYSCDDYCSVYGNEKEFYFEY